MLPLIGQVMKVSFPSRGSQDEYQIVAVAYEDSKLVATVPTKMDNPKTQFEHNQPVLVKYRASDGALLSFQAEVMQVSLHPPQLELLVPPDHKIKREQRREFVRVSVGLPVRIEVVVKQGKSNQFDLHMRDMSGGGIGVLLPPSVSFPVGTTVRALFTLPNEDTHIDLRSLVVRISARNEYDFAVCSLRFMDIKESVRQKIIQYTFIRQRELSYLKKNI